MMAFIYALLAVIFSRLHEEGPEANLVMLRSDDYWQPRSKRKW